MTVIVKDPVPVKLPVSVAVTEIVYVPATVGVPVSTPALESVKPGGKPAARKVYGAAPPVALNDPEKLAPTLAPGKLPATEIVGLPIPFPFNKMVWLLVVAGP